MSKRTVPQESDIIIHPDGRISVSFLWRDLIQDESLPSPGLVHEVRCQPVVFDEEVLLREYSNCRLCPRECGFDRVTSRHPRCGDAHLRVGTWGISMGDEPSIRGARGSGTILLSGCPLKCPSCHNPEMVQDGSIVPMQDFLEICYQLQEQGAENIQILSPTVHYPRLRALLTVLKEQGFDRPIIMKSSGFESVTELRKLEGLVDIYLPDLKFGSCSAYARRAGVANYLSIAKEALTEMHRQTGNFQACEKGYARRGVFVRHVLAPLPPTEREEILRYLESLKPRFAISLLDNFTSFE